MKSVIKRILGTIPVLIGVVLLIFIMLRIVPGNAAAMLLGEHVDQATIERLTEVMGLDKPVIVQFFDYLGRGESMGTWASVINITALLPI
mgnify:CR=1 FL=1